MVKAAFVGSDNMLLCAPTGAEKQTIVVLMTMLNLIGQHCRDEASIDLESFKIVYVAPMKALVQEVVRSFSKKLAPFDMHVCELFGDRTCL